MDKENGLNPDNIFSGEDNNNDDDIIDIEFAEDEDKDSTKDESSDYDNSSMPVESDSSQNDISLKEDGLSSIDKMLETNISDWDYNSARNYVVEFISVAKRYKDDYLEKMEELRKWAKRLDLARKHNRPELIEESERMFAKVSVEAEGLKDEYKKMKMHADVLKEQLADKNQYIPENDPTILLNKLETLLNKDSGEIQLEKDLKDISLQDKLDDLKKKIKKDESE
jgi:hypothetical protein